MHDGAAVIMEERRKQDAKGVHFVYSVNTMSVAAMPCPKLGTLWPFPRRNVRESIVSV